MPATNVTVDHATLRYSKSEKRIRSALTVGEVFDYSIPGQRWIFKDVLKPNEIIHNMAGEGALRDAEKAIDVLIFDISYYRDTDGQAFAKRCPYYVDGSKILTPSQFRGHPAYDIRETANYLPQVRKTESPDSRRRQ